MPAAWSCCRNRKYAKALYILNDYNDRNTVVAHLSLDHNERAMELLATMPKDAVTEYLRPSPARGWDAKRKAGSISSKHAAWTGVWNIGGNLDPEIAELLKQ